MEILKNIPAFKFTIILIAGIISGYEFKSNPFIQIIIIIILIISIIIILHFNNSFERLIHIFLLTLLIFFFGMFRASTCFYFFEEDSIKYFPETQKNSEIKLSGIVKEIPDSDSIRIRFILTSDLIISTGDTFMISGDVACDIRKNMFSKSPDINICLDAGDKIILTGKLLDPSGKRNPGEFDYKKYLRIHNIHKTFFANGFDKIEKLSGNNLGFVLQEIIIPAKIFTLDNIDKNYDKKEGAFLKGLLTGDKSDISEDMKNDFVNAGVMHLLAVSGLNVTYIIIFLMLFLSIFRIALIPKTFLTILFLIFYCLFTGSSASILRAGIMGILVLTSIIIERRIIFYNLIGISAAIILIYDPGQLSDAGFILSYSATLSMVIFYTKFEKLFPDKILNYKIYDRKIILAIFILFFTSLAAQIGTIPITANYFGKISIISLLANVVAVPLANLSLAIGFLQILTGIFSQYISSVISETNGVLLYLQLTFIKWCASLEFAYIKVNEFSLMDLIFFYGIILILYSIKNKTELLFKIFLCFLFISGNFISGYNFFEKLTVTFLDVGQGDCALIRTHDNKSILIDCGKTSFISDSGERTILPYLQREGISKIDILIITHLHLDHIGGLNSLLKNIKIDKIIESGQTYKSEFIITMDSLISAKNISREVIAAGDFITEFKDLRIYFLFPEKNYYEKNSLNDNLNNGSVAFMLKYGETDFLFTGDIEKESEEFLNRIYSDFLKTDVLKVAHHGSITSSTIPFILNNKPDYAVISCGKYNKFNHPSDIILNRLDKAGSKIYRTDISGAVIMESDGKEINIIDWR